MKKFLIGLGVLMASGSAMAQQTHSSDRIATQIGQMFIQLQQQQDQIAGMQAQLQQEKMEVKRLKEKYEPEAEAKPPPSPK